MDARMAHDWLTGICHGTNQAPGYRAVPMDACFWTPGFAIHLAHRWFSLIKHANAPGGTNASLVLPQARVAFPARASRAFVDVVAFGPEGTRQVSPGAKALKQARHPARILLCSPSRTIRECRRNCSDPLSSGGSRRRWIAGSSTTCRERASLSILTSSRYSTATCGGR